MRRRVVLPAIALGLGALGAGCAAHPRRVEGPPPEYEVPDDADAATDAASAPNAADASPGVIDTGSAEPPAPR